jgi:hypothetical protein
MLLMGVNILADRNPIEFSKEVLDQRNDLTGPDDSGKAAFPVRPKRVKIQQSKNRE